MTKRVVSRTLISLACQALLLFVPAGTLAWPQAWVFLALVNGCGAIFAEWLRRYDPDLLAERMASPLKRDQTPRDRAVMGAILLAFTLWLVVIALDARRFGWSHVPVWAQAVGACLIVATFVLWAGVLRANRFAGTRLRLQPERGHIVIDTGPYAIVRHPMYADTLLTILGIPLLLGSAWGLLGIVVIVPLLALRLLGEEAMLIDGLPGYRDYAARVRARLVPGVW